MFGRLINSLPFKILRGYDHPELVEMVFQKTVAYRPTDTWLEMVGVNSVIDFGGGCGRHYRDAAKVSPDIKWAVVETIPMVARAKELETDNLRFFTSIGAAASWIGNTEIVYSNGAIQYAPDPLSIVKELCAVQADRMLWYRLVFGDGETKDQISPLGDNGPGKQKIVLKRISYEQTTIREGAFLEAHQGYLIEERGKDWFKFKMKITRSRILL